MIGEQLWNIFIAAKISDNDLRSLGHDLYFARKAPTGGGVRAVVAFGQKLGIIPRTAYNAMNSDPGRSTLETLGLDYEKRLPWERIHPSTRAYAEKTAERLNRVASPPPATGGGGGQRSAPPARSVAAEAATEKKPMWPVIVGAVGTVGLIAGLSYVSMTGQRETTARHHREQSTVGRT